MIFLSGITCIFVFSQIWQTYSQSIVGGSFIRLEKFEQCPDKKEMENRYENITINSGGLNKIKVSGFFRVNHPVTNHATLKSVMRKCASKDEPDTCEYYYTYNTDKFCDFISQKNMPWSGFLESTNLTLSCPIKKGVYLIDQATLDTTKLPNYSFNAWILEDEKFREKWRKIVVLCGC